MSDEFFQAIKAGDVAAVGRFLAQDPALVDAKGVNDISALMLAIYNMQGEVAQLLVDRGASMSFFESAAFGDPRRVEEFLKKAPGLVHAYSPDGFTALGLACFFGNKEVIDLLLVRGAEPNAISQNQMRVVPLHSAVAHRDKRQALEMTKALLAAGAQINVSQHGGWTPLHHATADGHEALAELLLDHGADVNIKSDDGTTPIQLAIRASHTGMVELLQRRGAI